MSKKHNPTGPDACVAMHAALRKVCDSTQTSALYNVIHLLPDWPAPGSQAPLPSPLQAALQRLPR